MKQQKQLPEVIPAEVPAGIQADIKTMIANGVYAMSAITALTAQNTTGVTGNYGSNTRVSRDRNWTTFLRIFVPDAVKIGMVSARALIENCR